MIQAVPILEHIKKDFSHLSSGIVDSETHEASHELTHLLSKVTFEAINKIKLQDIWCVACLLHPGLSYFHFISPVLTSECRTIGEAFLRRMLADTIAPSCQSNFTFGQSSQEKSHRDASSSTIRRLGISSWGLATQISFLTATKNSSGEFSSYLSMQKFQ